MDYQIITFSKENFADQNIWDICDQQLDKHLSQTECGIAVLLLSEMAAGVDMLNWLSKWQQKCEESNKQFFIITEDTDQQECIEFSHPDLNLVYFSSKEELLNTYPEFSQNPKKKNNDDTSSKPVFDFNYNSIPPNVEDKISYPEVIKDDSEIIDSSNPGDIKINDSTRKSNLRDDSENKDKESKSNQGGNEEKSCLHNNKNEIEKKPDLDFSGTIKKGIDVLIEEKIKDYFGKRNASENSFKESDTVESEENVTCTSLFKETSTTIEVGSIIDVAGEYECCKCNFKRMYVKGDIAATCENPECLSSVSGWKLSFDLF